MCQQICLLFFLSSAFFSLICVGNIDQREAFQTMLRPHMLRRLKADVLSDLPEKREIVVPVPLRYVHTPHSLSLCCPCALACCARSPLQVHYYQEVLGRNYEILHRNVKASSRVSLANICMQLRKVCACVCAPLAHVHGDPVCCVPLFPPPRQVCNHPFLMSGIEENTIRDAGLPVSVNNALVDVRIHNLLVESSGKLQVRWSLRACKWSCCKPVIFAVSVLLQLLAKLLPVLKARGHRVLIFSQFLGVLSVLEDFLTGLGRFDPTFGKQAFCRIDGSTSTAVRQRNIADFNKPDSPYFVMLISTRAGGQGVWVPASC